MKFKYTPENIEELELDQIFVYGANEAGCHGAGAAKVAYKKFGAAYGKYGFNCSSYGIPTKDENIQTLSLDKIKRHVDEFISFVASRPDLEFLVTKIGCGLAGYKIEEIAELFRNRKYIPPNIVFPKEFHDYIYGFYVNEADDE